MCLVITPAIDLRQRLGFLAEVKVSDFCPIVVLHIPFILRLKAHMAIIIANDDVGNLECHRRIRLRCLIYQFPAEFIHRLCLTFTEADDRGNLLDRVARSTIIEHPQYIGHTDRRDNATLLSLRHLTNRTEEIEREIGVLSNKCTLLLSQYYRACLRQHVNNHLRVFTSSVGVFRGAITATHECSKDRDHQ